MPKYCLNYDTGDYEWIDEDGYSIDRGECTYNWDDSEDRQREEEERRQEEEREEEERRREEDERSWNDEDSSW